MLGGAGELICKRRKAPGEHVAFLLFSFVTNPSQNHTSETTTEPEKQRGFRCPPPVSQEWRDFIDFQHRLS